MSNIGLSYPNCQENALFNLPNALLNDNKLLFNNYVLSPQKSPETYQDKGYSDFDQQKVSNEIDDEIEAFNKFVQWGNERANTRAIPLDLFWANYETISGDDALEALAGNQFGNLKGWAAQYETFAVQKLRGQLTHISGGGLIRCGTTLDGGRGEVPSFRPYRPRQIVQGFGPQAKVKTVKVETPAGKPATPILPVIPDQYLDLICKRFEVKRLEGESPWELILRENLPIAIGEGDKVDALIAQGFPAIEVRGITQWHEKGKTELHPLIAQFATPGRTFYICFDEDSKPKTKAAVNQQSEQLAEAITSLGCKVKHLHWNGHQGKGVDDFLASFPIDERWAAVDGLLDQAWSTKEFQKQQKRERRARQIQESLFFLQQSQRLTYPTTRHSTGQYGPPTLTPEVGELRIFDWPMGSGKSTEIVRLVREWISGGGIAVILVPNNALGRQIAKAMNIPHIHDYSIAQQEFLESDISRRGGLVLCPDSLHRVPAWIWQREVLAVLDEAGQIADHMVEGNTLKGNWDTHNRKFCEFLACATAVIASESGLTDDTVKFLSEVSGKDHITVYKHEHITTPRKITLYTGGKATVSGFRALMLQASSQVPILIVTSSQAEGKRLERYYQKHRPKAKVIRIDSETNQNNEFLDFFEDPDTWLEQEEPDVLILSPTVKSGSSIQGGISFENAYFKSVWAYFPSLETDLHLQMLGRFRPAVPCNVYVPEWINGFGDDSTPWAAKAKLQEHLSQEAAVFGFDFAPAPEVAALQNSIFDYLHKRRAVRWHQRQVSQAWLAHKLSAAGHMVSCQSLERDSELQEEFKAIRSELETEESELMAGLEIEEHHSVAWANQILGSSSSSHRDRLRARKVLARADFPGFSFDQAAECLLLIEDYGRAVKGAKRLARAKNLEAARAIDQATAVKLMSESKLKPWHKRPTQFLEAAAISASGALAFESAPFQSSDRAVQAVKDTVLSNPAIGYYLGLNFTKSQSPAEIVSKILKRCGLETNAIKHAGPRGHRERIYQVQPPPELFGRMVAAYEEKLCTYLLILKPDLLESSVHRMAAARVTAGLEAIPLPRNRGGGDPIAV